MSAGSHSVLAPRGAPAYAAAEVSWVLIVGAALVFVGVMGLLAWTLLRRRRAAAAAGAVPGRPAAAPPGGVALWLAGGGVLLPALVLAVLFGYETVRGGAPAGGAGDIVVSVTGRAWWWQVRYRDPASGRDVVLANEIHVPAGRAVLLGLNSGDVIHSFWVPALAGKVDMIPGRVQQLRVVAAEPGVYRGQCAEFCGEQHAHMALDVVVETPDAFAAWLAAQAAPAAAPRGALAERGLAVFAAQRCAGCHAVRGLVEGAEAGPDLTHVASRRNLGAGVLPADEAGLRRWVAGVQHVKPGARMPSYDRLGEADLGALAAFLAQLK